MTTFTDSQRSFLDGDQYAVVATLSRDGTPSQSIVWYVRDGDTLWISVRPDSVKARHIARDPRVSVLITSDDGGRYLRVEGMAARDGAVDTASRRLLIGRYVGAEQADAWMAAHPLLSPNARIRIQPTHVVEYNLAP